jgi:Domain of unknown function (DUF4288)
VKAFASAEQAHALAVRKGREAQHRYKNQAGSTVHFEFVGLLELLELGVECGPDEVWYDLKYLVRPKERSAKLIPPKRKLSAIYLSKVWTRRV